MHKIIRGLHNLPQQPLGCVATIGNFDGIHIGHQAVLTQLVDKGKALGLPSVVITFEPQANEFFARQAQAPARLSRFRDKVVALSQYGIHTLCVLRFNQALANLSANHFIHRLLVTGLAVRYLVVGDDFRFGKGREGDFTLLVAAGKQYGFEVVNMATFTLADKRVSRTRFRHALADNNLQQVQALLGQPYTISGRVTHGDKKGRTIGFPTANVPLRRRTTPLHGVYVVQVAGIEEGVSYYGVANVGTRPTVSQQQTPLLEVHLLSFSGDIYGRYIQVSFLAPIRREQQFASLDALTEQIRQDCEMAREYIADNDLFQPTMMELL